MDVLCQLQVQKLKNFQIVACETKYVLSSYLWRTLYSKIFCVSDFLRNGMGWDTQNIDRQSFLSKYHLRSRTDKGIV